MSPVVKWYHRWLRTKYSRFNSWRENTPKPFPCSVTVSRQTSNMENRVQPPARDTLRPTFGLVQFFRLCHGPMRRGIFESARGGWGSIRHTGTPNGRQSWLGAKDRLLSGSSLKCLEFDSPVFRCSWYFGQVYPLTLAFVFQCNSVWQQRRTLDPLVTGSTPVIGISVSALG